MEEDVSALQEASEGMNEYLDQDQMVANDLPEDREAASLAKPMSEYEWAEATPEEMAQHISLEGPKTDYAKEVNPFRKDADRLQNFWLDRIDSMDPSLGQDVTSAFMDTQKT